MFFDECTLIIMRPGFHNRNIEVDTYFSVEFDLSVKAYFKGEMFSISQVTLSDIRQLVSILDEISNPPPSIDTEIFSTNSNNASHIASAERHLQQIIDNMHETKSDDELIPYPEVSRLQFIICQLQNSLVPKNRRRYNVLTQILSLKTHLISPVSYQYLQSMSCLSLPHPSTSQKLYSSFFLENEFFTYLKQDTQSFSGTKTCYFSNG